MEITKIALKRLLAHPANSNRMSAERFGKLVGHLERSGCYEPLVVRECPRREDYYQLLNGHHRKAALEKLGYESADCLVWKVSDAEALMLLATLNRLSGEDDPAKRGALLKQLSVKFDRESLLKRLPEKQRQLEKLLEITRPVQLAEPGWVGQMPQAITFFVDGEQRETVEKALRVVRQEVGGETREQVPKRGELLAAMAEKFLADDF